MTGKEEWSETTQPNYIIRPEGKKDSFSIRSASFIYRMLLRLCLKKPKYKPHLILSIFTIS